MLDYDMALDLYSIDLYSPMTGAPEAFSRLRMCMVSVGALVSVGFREAGVLVFWRCQYLVASCNKSYNASKPTYSK